MAETTGQPLGPLQYRLTEDGTRTGLFDANGAEVVLTGTLPNVVNPTASPYTVALNGLTVSTAGFQAALTAAKSNQLLKDSTHYYGYGYGGKVLIPCGIPRIGPVSFSRSVSIEGSAALASTTIYSDYSSLGGVAGEDSLLTQLDDGTADGGITQQNKLFNFAVDGRRTDAPVGHIRHGLNYTNPDDGTDRIATIGDLHVMNFPGAAWKVFANGQVRGGNFKATGNDYGLYWERVKDGKLDQIGLGKNVKGNKLINCASLKLGKVDIWTGPSNDGSSVLELNSCAKCVLTDGEIEGMVVVIGTNNDGNDKSYREQQCNTFQSINFKLSEDFHAVAGEGNIATGAGYVALVKVLDANGIRLPNCSGKYKLGQPESDTTARHMPFAPKVFVWLGTQIDPADPQYDDWLEACGDVDMTGATLLWHVGKGTPGRRSIPIVPFKEHISNLPCKIKGLRLGNIYLRPTGTQMQDEIPLDGATYTSDYYPLLYLRLDPDWGALTGPTRFLSDRDGAGPGADPTTGYVTFTVPTLAGPAGFTYYMVYEQ